MQDTTSPLAMGESGQPHVVLLPRDPETGYVYWEWPEAGTASNPAKLTILVEDDDGGLQTVMSFDVHEATGGRFFGFARRGARHLCRLQWGEELESAEFVSPRREAGNEAAAFVQVRLSEEGLLVEPTEHDHPIHGRFPASKVRAPSSREYTSARFHRQ